MWVDTRSVHSDNPGWRDMVSSCFHEWLGTFMIAVRSTCLPMHLQNPSPQKQGRGGRLCGASPARAAGEPSVGDDVITYRVIAPGAWVAASPPLPSPLVLCYGSFRVRQTRKPLRVYPRDVVGQHGGFLRLRARIGLRLLLGQLA